MWSLFGIFGAGPWELIIFGLIVLVIFGNRLPAVMRSMGKSVVEFKKGINDVEEDDKAVTNGKNSVGPKNKA